jgi:cytochrome c551/c552
LKSSGINGVRQAIMPPSRELAGESAHSLVMWLVSKQS